MESAKFLENSSYRVAIAAKLFPISLLYPSSVEAEEKRLCPITLKLYFRSAPTAILF